jgi:hypothetical protein
MNKQISRTVAQFAAAVLLAVNTYAGTIRISGPAGVGSLITERPAPGAVAISADGNYVVFGTIAKLAIEDNNGYQDIYLYDRTAQTYQLISKAPGGNVGNHESSSPTISPNGRFIGFQSKATNLALNDTNKVTDGFIFDQITGELTRILAPVVTQPNGRTSAPVFSADGSKFAFWTEATNFMVGDVNGKIDVFVQTRATGETVLISQSSDGTQSDADAYQPTISDDSNVVSFVSAATNLAPGDLTNFSDVYVRVIDSSDTYQVPATIAGGSDPHISPNGFRVVFTDMNATPPRGFLYDWLTDSLSEFTDAPADEDAGRGVELGSANIWFALNNSVIFLADGKMCERQFLIDTTLQVPESDAGDFGSGTIAFLAASRDLRTIAFRSNAPDLVPNDTNGAADIFVLDRNTPATTPIVAVSNQGTASGENGGVASFLLTREGDTSAPLTVQYVMSGSAKNGKDYERLIGAAQFAVGQSAIQLRVRALVDRKKEGAEKAILTIKASETYIIEPGKPAAAIKIRDAD